jgi:predicted Rossmann fold nucleotide-binding protein DprA/Smf involved in DNA uptake
MNVAEERKKEFWLLWNQLYKQVGPVRFEQLLKAFGLAEKAWKAPAKEFERLGWGQKRWKYSKTGIALWLQP